MWLCYHGIVYASLRTHAGLPEIGRQGSCRNEADQITTIGADAGTRS
nr:hypothetical protein REQ54_02294 [Rhizobium sp. Q54]